MTATCHKLIDVAIIATCATLQKHQVPFFVPFRCFRSTFIVHAIHAHVNGSPIKK